MRELGASLSQGDHTCICDLYAATEVQIRELGAPLGQNHHTCIRDLFAAIQFHNSELGTLLRQLNQTSICDLVSRESQRRQQVTATLTQRGGGGTFQVGFLTPGSSLSLIVNIPKEQNSKNTRPHPFCFSFY